MGMPEIDVGTGRLTVATAREIYRLVGGDPVTERQIDRFIGARYQARNLLYLPLHVAAAILARPADFIVAARRFCQAEVAGW
jgi:hypothetical protein